MTINPVSETELYILEYLWSVNEPKSFAELLQYFTTEGQKDWKKQTLNTFLLRLTQKGYLHIDHRNHRRIYSPTISHEEYQQQYAHQIIDKSFNSSLLSFVSAFTGDQKISAEEKNELLDYLKGLQV